MEQYSTAIDMWSVGCIMAELLAKEPLFQGKTELDQLDKVIIVFCCVPLFSHILFVCPFKRLVTFCRYSEFLEHPIRQYGLGLLICRGSKPILSSNRKCLPIDNTQLSYAAFLSYYSPYMFFLRIPDFAKNSY